MNLAGLVFALLAYSVLKFMIIGDVAGQPQPDIPEFGQFDTGLEFITPECGNPIFLCIDYLGDVIYNISTAFIKAVEFLMNVVTYFILLLVFIGSISVQTLPDAPWYVNILLLTPYTFLIALMLFKLVRKGDDE